MCVEMCHTNDQMLNYRFMHRARICSDAPTHGRYPWGTWQMCFYKHWHATGHCSLKNFDAFSSSPFPPLSLSPSLLCPTHSHTSHSRHTHARARLQGPPRNYRGTLPQREPSTYSATTYANVTAARLGGTHGLACAPFKQLAIVI